MASHCSKLCQSVKGVEDWNMFAAPLFFIHHAPTLHTLFRRSGAHARERCSAIHGASLHAVNDRIIPMGLAGEGIFARAATLIKAEKVHKIGKLIRKMQISC